MFRPDSALLFSGDWEWQPDLECHVMAFEAVTFADDWNGHAVPIVTERVARALVHRFQLLRLEEGPAQDGGYDEWAWDGEALTITDTMLEEYRIQPDDAGHYTLDIGYTFSHFKGGEDERILAVISSEL